MATIETPSTMHLPENQELMVVLGKAIIKKININTDGLEISTCFEDTTTQTFFERPKFLICLDESYKDLIEPTKSVLRAHGIREEDSHVSLRHLFLRKAMQQATSHLLEGISQAFGLVNNGEVYGSYSPWLVETNPYAWSEEPMIPLWFKDLDLLAKVAKSEQFSGTLPIKKAPDTIIHAQIIHSYTP